MFRRRLGPYQLVAFRGSGDSGEVYRAVDTRSGRGVALKLFFSALARDPISSAGCGTTPPQRPGCTGPHVLPVHEVGTLRGRPFAAIRLIEGRDLGTG
jgi:serine/threonine protein kinase